ncbi:MULTISPECIES: hypothetical protein [Paraburkholderia]|uniref:hypothetical protein n=1 Tax=Paraburkholderia TaxID=1822464 RepID=UPI001405439C|nr:MULTISPECIES: hypothetical protein [Paraburkholderia]MDR6474431.1 hypothetical protein [Paraburkholderia graminis]
MKSSFSDNPTHHTAQLIRGVGIQSDRYGCNPHRVNPANQNVFHFTGYLLR